MLVNLTKLKVTITCFKNKLAFVTEKEKHIFQDDNVFQCKANEVKEECS